MIELAAVRKVFADGHVAVHELSLQVPAGRTLALLGPSGCGKTTTLKLINRLLAPTAGRILLDGRDTAAVDPVLLRRRIGYVVQDAGLFPHFDVRANIETVPRLLGWPAARRAARVEELLALVGLDAAYGGRYPAQLSGGERQRVGLARALAADPDIVLMDEPFAALDPPTRHRLQGEFAALRSRLRQTVVLVTHDVDEAFRLADLIAVLDAGRLVQVGTADAIRQAPAPFVATFLSHAPGAGA